MEFAQRIRELRRKRGWSVYELAERIDKTAGYVSKIEARGEIPSPEMICTLANVLGADANDLFKVAKTEKARQAASSIAQRYDEALALYRKGKIQGGQAE